MNDYYNVKSLADRVALLELKASYTPYIGELPVKTWRLRRDVNGVACVDCSKLCHVSESAGQMLVACPTCGHSVQKPTYQFRAVLDEHYVYEIPVKG
jgi:ribosomal protein S27E